MRFGVERGERDDVLQPAQYVILNEVQNLRRVAE